MSRYIDADVISANIHSWLDGADSDVVYIDRTELFDLIDNTPSIERKRGKWIERKQECEYRCSECGKIVFADDENELNFCCSCGADMREREGE